MQIFRFLFGFGIDRASAATLDEIYGTNSPGVRAMWDMVCDVMPYCDVGINAPEHFALKVTGVVLQMIGGVAVAVLIYAGIKMIMSRGNDEGLNEAKKIAAYALGGVVLAVIADALVQYVAEVIIRAAG